MFYGQGTNGGKSVCKILLSPQINHIIFTSILKCSSVTLRYKYINIQCLRISENVGRALEILMSYIMKTFFLNTFLVFWYIVLSYWLTNKSPILWTWRGPVSFLENMFFRIAFEKSTSDHCSLILVVRSRNTYLRVCFVNPLRKHVRKRAHALVRIFYFCRERWVAYSTRLEYWNTRLQPPRRSGYESKKISKLLLGKQHEIKQIFITNKFHF